MRKCEWITINSFIVSHLVFFLLLLNAWHAKREKFTHIRAPCRWNYIRVWHFNNNIQFALENASINSKRRKNWRKPLSSLLCAKNMREKNFTPIIESHYRALSLAFRACFGFRRKGKRKIGGQQTVGESRVNRGQSLYVNS